MLVTSRIIAGFVGAFSLSCAMAQSGIDRAVIAYPAAAEAVTRGGADGDIVRVTTLSANGPGSLRAALEREGPRIVVFEVGGVIDLAGETLRIDSGEVTVAGQTAPSPGVTIVKGGLVIAADDVIVQHLRIRPGDLGEPPRSGRDIDAITTLAAHRVIIDHNSLTWATDENLSASGPRFTGESPSEWRDGTSGQIVFTNNLIAEGLANSTHAKGEHSKGSLIHDNVSDIVIARNLYAHNVERSPLFKGGVQGTIANNLIYNPGQRAIHYNLQGLEWGEVPPETGRMVVANNVLRGGPDTAEGLPLVMVGGQGDVDLVLSGNVGVDRWGEPLPEVGRYTTTPVEIVRSEAFDLQELQVDLLPASSVEEHVLRHAGARPWDRDANDVRIFADTAEGRGAIIDSQEEVGGYPMIQETRAPFVPERWNLDRMTPADAKALDASSEARGT